jgi:2-oxoglutarate dehydrogenase E2 component (dihydrolipoamide succinyltransferase)
MVTKIIVPALGESITEATIAKWYKKQGEAVKIDELLLELETDKVTLEVNASCTGVISNIVHPQGSTVMVGEIVGEIDETATVSVAATATSSPAPQPTAIAESKVSGVVSNVIASPAASKIASENGLNLDTILSTGKDGRVTKGDVIQALSQPTILPSTSKIVVTSDPERETRIKMSRLRKKIAERLKDSQNTAAILTTFNEIDMSNVIEIRNKYKDIFEKKHGVKLGFMSFFTKAVIHALKEVPAVNAQIDGDDLVYKNYYDISVAVGTEQGLVVPVVRDADKKNFAEIEKTIGELGKKARDGKLTMEDMMGGVFTISNGGVYGSLLSTPIINPPQSGILGMHKTQERAVVINGKIEIRPMMYIALSYDHRVIDGKEAVTFLIKVKEAVENPERLLFDL